MADGREGGDNLDGLLLPPDLEGFLSDLEGFLSDVGENENSPEKLEDANNITKAACHDILTMASKKDIWIEATPELEDVLKGHLEVLRGKTLPELRAEYSIESAIVPVAPERLVSMMVDAGKWASSFCHIVYRATSSIPTGVLGQLNSKDHGVLNVQVVNAEFHLPTPMVESRKSCFLRWQTPIIPEAWAILDLSFDYLPYCASDLHLEPNHWKKPSGVIIRKHADVSEVIWIENTEVEGLENPLQDNIYSSKLTSELAFSARRWLNALLWKLQRDQSRFLNATMLEDEVKHGMASDEQAKTCLLRITESLKMAYLGCVHATPDQTKWVILHDHKGIRILKNRTAGHDDDIFGLNAYIAVSSFQVQAEPNMVFNFLAKKNLEIQWRNTLVPEEHEELVRLANVEEENCITLHRKTTEYIDSTKFVDYLLQEASRDNFCSFIISAPMTQHEVTDAIRVGRGSDVSSEPSGFAIMPNVQSGGSLVTIAMHQQLDWTNIEHIVESMSCLLNTIIEEINEKFSGRRYP